MKRRSLKKVLSVLLCAATLATATFTGTTSASYEGEDSCVWEIVPGDANGNGSVNIDDVVYILKYVAGWKSAKKNLKIMESDVNGDGNITIGDALKMMKYFAGWQGIRLCHDDAIEYISEASETEYGEIRLTCKKCGSTDVALSPKTSKTSLFNIKGVELSEYTIVYGECPGDSPKTLAYEFSDALYNVTGQRLEVSSQANKFEHEFLIGVTDRDGVPELDPKSPRAGMLDNGNVYFIAYNSAMVRFFLDEFIQDHFGGNFGATLGRDIPRNPWGEECNEWESVVEELDLESEGYSLKFADEFDGDELNRDLWKERIPGRRRDGINDPSMVSVRDGNLVIGTEYKEHTDGNMYWFADAISLKEWYCRGYFEISAKLCDPSYGYWSAFWIQGKSPYIPGHSQGGLGYGGTEIDILENNTNLIGTASHNIYCAGAEGYYHNDGICPDPDNMSWYTGYHSEEYVIGDVENEYHTYSLLWDEDWYTFYVDGIPVGRTNYGDGTSQVPEEIILSVELGYGMPVPGDEGFEELTQRTNEFLVDYVRVYQK